MESLLKEQIFKILKDNLYNIYCYTCLYEKNECGKCDECHRKHMNWEPSDKFINLIVAGIISFFKEDLERYIEERKGA